MAAKNIIRVLLLTAVVGIAFQTQASAETITFSASFGPTTSPFDMTYIFAGFDPNLGTLNQVFLHADESISTTGSITNLSQDTGPWKIQLDGSVRALFTNAAGDSGIGTPPVPPTKTLIVPSIDPNTSYLVNLSTADLNDINLPANLVLNGETIAQFFETGPITANLHADGSAGITAPDSANYSSSLTTSISGSFSVTYDYTPVPEPASGQMIAIGLAGLFAITYKTRRRRSRA